MIRSCNERLHHPSNGHDERSQHPWAGALEMVGKVLELQHPSRWVDEGWLVAAAYQSPIAKAYRKAGGVGVLELRRPQRDDELLQHESNRCHDKRSLLHSQLNGHDKRLKLRCVSSGYDERLKLHRQLGEHDER